MLELIVLGQIPGTEIYIPFKSYLLFLLGLLFTAIIYRYFSAPKRFTRKLQKRILDIAL